MTAFDLEFHFLAGAQVHALLGQGDGRRRPQGGFKDHRHAVCDAAVDPPGVVGFGDHLPVLHGKGVVGLAAPHQGKGHPGAKGHALHRGNGKEVLRKDPLHVAAEVRSPQPRAQAGHGALDGSAHGVLRLLCLQNGLLHLSPRCVVQHGEVFFRHAPQLAGFLQRCVADSVNGADMGAHPYALPGQKLLGHRPRRHQRRGQAPGKVAAAPVILAAAAFQKAGVIPMAGPGGVADGVVIRRVLVGIPDDHRQRRAGGLALEHAGEHPDLVGLLPGGGQGAPARPAPVQLPLHRLQVQRQPGGHALQHHADGLAVGFPEDGVLHVMSPPRLL